MDDVNDGEMVGTAALRCSRAALTQPTCTANAVARTVLLCIPIDPCHVYKVKEDMGWLLT